MTVNRMRRMILPVLLLVFLAQGTVCLAAGTPEVTVKEQKAVLSPMIVGAGAAFMTIVNAGSGDDALVRARTDMAGTIVEPHDFKDGKMIRAEDIPIPAKGAVSLRPGGLHIMIFNIPKSVKEGHSFDMTLVFEKSGEMTIPFRFASPPFPSSHH
jgi:periplasmic copper chaperone A